MFLYSTADYTVQYSKKQQKCSRIFCAHNFVVNFYIYLKRKKRVESAPHTSLPNYTKKSSKKRQKC